MFLVSYGPGEGVLPYVAHTGVHVPLDRVWFLASLPWRGHIILCLLLLPPRGHSYHFIKDKIQRVNAIPGSTALETTSNTKETNRIPFVVTFNQALPNIHKIECNDVNCGNTNEMRM